MIEGESDFFFWYYILFYLEFNFVGLSFLWFDLIFGYNFGLIELVD